MTRFTRTMLIAGITLATTFASVANLQAGCGGGGGYRRYSPSYSRPSYHQPAYRPQPQPVYQPAPQPQPGFQQPAPQPSFQQPVQQPAPQIQPVAPVAQQQGPAVGNDAELTALQALAGMTGQSQPQVSVAPAAPTQAPGIAGTWTARLNNGAVVQLTLQADGSFHWSATNKTGLVSSFQGSYTTTDGSLTLVRSEGNRKLAGTLAQTSGNAFNFKLAGANDNGLDFVRS